MTATSSLPPFIFYLLLSVIADKATVETNKLNDEQYQIMRRHFLG